MVSPRKPNSLASLLSQNTSFNYGVLCGPANGITVVDVNDYKSPSNPKLLNEMMAMLLAANTYTVSTPSGGKHFYFKHVPDFGTTHNDPNVVPLDIQ